VHAAVGDQDGAGDAVRRNIGERGGKRCKQLGPVGFAIRRAGFRHTHFEAGNPFKPLNEGSTRGFGLLRAVAETLARLLSTMTAATEGIGSRSSRVSEGLASVSTISASASARSGAPLLRASSKAIEI